MRGPIRITAVLTHPIQYYTPWFRQIHTTRPELDLTVVYAVRPTPAQLGVGFGHDVDWGIPLTEGHRHVFLRDGEPGDSLSDFFGLDVPQVGPAIVRTRPEIVLVPGWNSKVLLRALWACRRKRLPTLYRGDSKLPLNWRDLSNLPWRVRTRLLLKLYRGFLCVGQKALEYLRAFGAPMARLYASPHCVDNEFFARAAAPHQTQAGRAQVRQELGLPEDAFVVLYLGKLQASKRPLDLIQALERLAGNVALLVVGAGQLEADCRRAVEDAGYPAAWTGFLSQPELPRAYAAADCLALPSDEPETWGLTVNEAMATGLPAVVSDRVGCGADLVTPGVTGDLFPLGDVDALAAALERVRAHSQAGDIATACRERISGYSFEAATEGLVEACVALARPPVPVGSDVS